MSHRTTFGCGVRRGGAVICWGANQYGQLGAGVMAAPAVQLGPTAVLSITDARAVSAGGSHACVLQTSGRVACWGFNSYGQLGDGTTRDSSRPVEVAGVDDAIEVQVTGDRDRARSNGRARCIAGATRASSRPASLP